MAFTGIVCWSQIILSNSYLAFRWGYLTSLNWTTRGLLPEFTEFLPDSSQHHGDGRLLCNHSELEPSNCVFCILLSLLLLCVKCHAHSVCRDGSGAVPTQAAKISQNRSLSSSKLASHGRQAPVTCTCLAWPCFCSLLVKSRALCAGEWVCWGMGVLSSSSLSCKRDWKRMTPLV